MSSNYNDPRSEHTGDWRRSENARFATIAAGAFLTLAAGFAAGRLTGTPPFGELTYDLRGVIIGLGATAPLLAFLYWFSKTDNEKLAAFRKDQIDFFANIGFRFTPMRIFFLAVAAGVTEEMLFRGVLQEWLARHLPLILAIILPNILFGALHWRTFAYAFIAGVVGVYLGVVFAVSGNLLAPIVTHTLYDVAALEYTRRAVEKRLNENG